MLLTVCTAVLIAGCAPADHRISLAAFLACERAFDSGPGPASRPADETDSLHRRLQAQLSPYTPGPGDLLTVALVTLDLAAPSPSVQVRVDEQGNVKLPIIGSINVGGKPLEE
ncbi:MAG: hypothetical protein GX616_26655, partial [Planctomycetes bacterium]|nr:hypothetical protein [Planctomycetota bacterium]